MPHSTESRTTRKPISDRPKKPYKDFPLTPHASGAWQKKIRGKTHYFSRWGRIRGGKMERLPDDGWKAALELYQAQRDDLFAGRTPRTTSGDGPTLKSLFNVFLTSKMRLVQSGEITRQTFVEYRSTTSQLITTFGKNCLATDLVSTDFELLRSVFAEKYGPARLCNVIQMVRTIFKFCFESGLIDTAVRYGPAFRKPSAAVLRKHRAAKGSRLFSNIEIRALLDNANDTMRAMVLLGINCAFGNADVASLPQTAIDLADGWATFPRPKTGIERRCALWQETVEALRIAIAARPKPTNKADSNCVFLTPRGLRFVRESGANFTRIDSVRLEFSKLLKALELDGRAGIGFYSLRRTHRTVADGAKDVVACRLVMGHADSSIDAVYRESIADGRLQAVSDHVHGWLFDTTEEEGSI